MAANQNLSDCSCCLAARGPVYSTGPDRSFLNQISQPGFGALLWSTWVHLQRCSHTWQSWNFNPLRVRAKKVAQRAQPACCWRKQPNPGSAVSEPRDMALFCTVRSTWDQHPNRNYEQAGFDHLWVWIKAQFVFVINPFICCRSGSVCVMEPGSAVSQPKTIHCKCCSNQLYVSGRITVEKSSFSLAHQIY